MLKLQKWFEPATKAQLVDCGRLRCPVEAQDVDVERCADCAFLRKVVLDDDGHVSEISCRPRLYAMRSVGL